MASTRTWGIRTRSMLDRRVDGMIFGDAHLDDPLLDELAEEGVPFVLVSRRRGDHVAVTCDDATGGRLAAEHLIAQGRTRPAVLAGMSFASTAVDRTRGFLEADAEAGMPVPPERVIQRGFDAAAGREATEAVLRDGQAPDALFATNDFAAIGAMGALRDAGLSVPDDVALVGYNDTALAASGSIGLTSVRSPVHEMGRLAQETLLALVDGPAPRLSPGVAGPRTGPGGSDATMDACAATSPPCSSCSYPARARWPSRSPSPGARRSPPSTSPSPSTAARSRRPRWSTGTTPACTC
ncbi:substrate-binding domain-containing protein [Clavibacter michiganensis]|uniref:substrate-binding domain-containing protein n=1 Tax=Clavibacter michiganensis TaxID=28447 RepID=UPI001F3EA1D9|nr:substrate-binding domain-containing protein [Clavibacter michiganensis]